MTFFQEDEESILLDIIYFKLSDNSVIKFTNRRLSLPDYSATTGYTNSFGFILEEEVLDALMNKEVIGIKCSVNEYNLSSKESKQVFNFFNWKVNSDTILLSLFIM